MAVRSNYWVTKPGTYPEDPPVDHLTSAGVDYMIAHKSPPPREDVRADSAGLRMIETMDESNRPIRTFELPAGASKASTWMRPYMAEPQEQVMINKKELPKDQFPAIEARWRERLAVRDQARRDMSAGKDVRFDIETGERLS